MGLKCTKIVLYCTVQMDNNASTGNAGSMEISPRSNSATEVVITQDSMGETGVNKLEGNREEWQAVH